MNDRYLTKSRFKLATECPTKLFYTKKNDYADQALDNPFLEALARGGYQVGELAKAYHPEGHAIKSLDLEQSLAETNKLLEQENVTIFEAAVRYKNLFIRIDVLRKQGNVFDLIEVKSKSIADEEPFISKKTGGISKKWFPYLIDVAFQEYVLRKAFPKAIIRPALMLADKTARTSVDGLNQHFKIIKTDGNRKETKRVGDCSPEALGNRVLAKVDVREQVKILQDETYKINGQTFTFEQYVEFLSEKYSADEKIPPKIDCPTCKKCTFKTTPADEAAGKKSGFKECWKEALSLSDADFQKPFVFDIWQYRKSQECVESGRTFMRDLSEDDFDPKSAYGPRQWMQVCKMVSGDADPEVDVVGLRQEMSGWKWPLHFIDFETSAIALPFTKRRRPYEVVAFQFSHHIAYEDGRIEHADEYINIEPAVFPNFKFVRALKAVLEKDDGTIFRYAEHENTVLNQIIVQLEDSEEPDRDELVRWIKTITRKKEGNKTILWEGARTMVDLKKLVVASYYQLDMGCSNSIKQVLPAVLNSSEYLQKKYAKPVYNGKNYTDWLWIQRDETGRVKDPYKLLPPVFCDVSPEDLLKVEDEDDALADGGAAMTAYARLQFSDVSEAEREAVRKALLRYCELDTLAMVMIWEEWQQLVKRA